MSVFEVTVCGLLGFLVIEHTFFSVWHYRRINREKKDGLSASRVAWETLALLVDDLKERRGIKK